MVMLGGDDDNNDDDDDFSVIWFIKSQVQYKYREDTENLYTRETGIHQNSSNLGTGSHLYQ